MKKVNFLVLFILLDFMSFAQDINSQIQKSDVFKDEFKKSTIVFSEKTENGNLILVREYDGSVLFPNKGFYVEEYNADLKLVKDLEYPVDHPPHEKNAVFIGVVKFGTDIHLIEMFYDIKGKAYSCVAHTVNSETLATGKKVLFNLDRDQAKQYGSFSLNGISMNTSGSNINRDRFVVDDIGEVIESIFIKQQTPENHNRSAIAFDSNNRNNAIAIALDLNGKDQEALKVFVFDQHLNAKFDAVYSKSADLGKYRFQNIELSEDGNSLYVVGKFVSKEDKAKENGGKYRFEIIKLFNGGKIVQTLHTNEYFIEGLKLVNVKDRLACLGFYSEKKEKRFKGVAYYGLNTETFDVKDTKFSPFSEQFLIDKYGEVKENELRNLIFKSVLTTKNGNIILNAEETYHFRNDNFSAVALPIGQGQQNTRYYHEDIVSVKVDSSGKLLWARNINKRQSTYDIYDPYLSFSAFCKDEDVYIFINAAEDLKKLSNNRIAFKDTNKSRYNLNALRIDENGEFTFKKILDDEQNEIPFMVNTRTYSDGSVFFLGRKGSKKQLLKITL